MLTVATGLLLPIGETNTEKLLNLYQLKHTAVNGIFAILENDLDLKDHFEIRQLMTLYHESHLTERQLISENQ